MESYFLLVVVAQSADPLSGGGGWVGAGLLGLVMGWLLLKHLPDKDKQIQAILDKQALVIEGVTEKHAEAVQSTADKYDASIKGLTDTFRSEAKAERESCERHFSSLADAMAKGSSATMAAFQTLADQIRSHSERNQQWTRLLQDEARKVMAAQETATEALKHREGGLP